MKACSVCGSQAEVSLVVLVSTLGLKPRQQKSSEAVSVCRGCLRGSEMWSGHQGSSALKLRVNEAVGALTERFVSKSHSECAKSSDLACRM